MGGCGGCGGGCGGGGGVRGGGGGGGGSGGGGCGGGGVCVCVCVLFWGGASRHAKSFAGPSSSRLATLSSRLSLASLSRIHDEELSSTC